MIEVADASVREVCTFPDMTAVDLRFAVVFTGVQLARFLERGASSVSFVLSLV